MLALRVCVSVARSILPVRRPRSAVLDWRMAETHKRNGKHATPTYNRLHMLLRNTKTNESVPAIPCMQSSKLQFTFFYICIYSRSKPLNSQFGTTLARYYNLELYSVNALKIYINERRNCQQERLFSSLKASSFH